MAGRVLRASIPIVLLVAGAASIAAGVKFNTHEVLAQIEQKQSAPKDLPGGPSAMWMQRGTAGQQGPQYIATWLKETEPQLIQEVTVGGLRLAEGGKIERTYSGDTPSLCPT